MCLEIDLEEAFRNCNYQLGIMDYELKDGRLPVAKELGETSLMFKVHPTLTEENMHYVVESIKKILNG